MNNIRTIRNIIFQTLLLLLCVSIKAQEYSPNQYTGERARTIAERLYTDYQIDCNNSKEAEVNELAIIIKRDRFQKIFHIGFKLFSNEMIDKYPSPVYNFIESYLLNLYLLQEDSVILRQMNEDKVQISFGNKVHKAHTRKQLPEAVPILSKSSSFVINIDNGTYTVTCTGSKSKEFEMSFPADYQLLSGMNKKESEQSFYTLLSAFPGNPSTSDTANIHALEKIGENSYVQRGETYQIKAMNTDRYYTSQNGTYEQLTDTLQAERSVHNLFTIQADQRINADVTLRLYGKKKIDFSIPLHKLLEFCKTDGCKIFAGIESVDTSLVKGTSILLNQMQGYSHTMSFEVNPKILSQPEKYRVKADLYIFAPIHNIQSIFFESKQ